jgi:tight adherence protein C
MGEWLSMAWVFLAGAGVSFVLLNLFRRRSNPIADRLKAEPDEDADPTPILGGWTADLAKQLPPSEEGALDIGQALRAAGFYRQTALQEYTALRWLLIILPVIGTAIAALLTEPPLLYWILGSGAALAFLGFSLPRVYLSLRTRWRNGQMERGLPIAIDLMTLGLSGGQTLQAALQLASHELKATHPVLAEELEITDRQAELHTLEHALQQWADRVRLPEVRTLALLLMQSERLGTDTATTLLEYASHLRVTLRQRAETKANQASFWMLIPSVFCLWIAAVIILVGPAYLEFWRYRQEAAELLKKGQKQVDQSNRQTLSAPGTTTARPTVSQTPAPPQAPNP